MVKKTFKIPWACFTPGNMLLVSQKLPKDAKIENLWWDWEEYCILFNVSSSTFAEEPLPFEKEQYISLFESVKSSNEQQNVAQPTLFE